MYNDSVFAGNATQYSINNRVRVLRLIRDESEITRGDIINKTGLSAPTVTRIVESLFAKKLIKQEDSGTSSGGRPPQIIKFEAKNNYVIGIDISGKFIRAAFSNLDGEFLYEIHLPTDIERGFDGIMEQLGDLIQKLLNRASNKKERVFGIGVSVCGIVDKHTGFVTYSPVLNWKNVDILTVLKAYTDLPISISNVAHLIAQGELYYGVGDSYNDFICLNLEYGIGSGIIIDRKPFYGSSGYSGEIGHIVVDNESRREGREGILGAFEAHSSVYGIIDEIENRIKSGEDSVLKKDLGSLSFKKILKAATNGDTCAENVISDASNYIGVGIDILIKVFNPEAIVLCGELIEGDDYIMNKVKEKIESISLPIYQDKVPILRSSFGEDAALKGAFSMILERVLSLE